MISKEKTVFLAEVVHICAQCLMYYLSTSGLLSPSSPDKGDKESMNGIFASSLNP